MTEEKVLKESQLKLQYLYEQIKEIEKQSQVLNKQMMELAMSAQNLDEFKKLKPDTQILIPINTGMYAKAKLTDTSELLVNVGSDVTIKKNIEDTKKLLQNQIVEIKSIQDNLVSNLQNLATKAGMLEKDIKKIKKK